jgi:CRISPR/Cas system CMR subunit Cmr4 (Cas7 group RAMP superfamily)
MISEVLKYTLPAVFVFVATYLVIYKFLANERHKLRSEAILNNQKIITPIRLQAYERMILFLERISLNSLVIRTQRPNITSQELQNLLLKNIRSEFEHNMAHQLYISDKAWEMVRSAKENCVKYINQTALQVKPDGPSIQLSKLILENMLDTEKEPTSKAISYLKTEIRELF